MTNLGLSMTSRRFFSRFCGVHPMKRCRGASLRAAVLEPTSPVEHQVGVDVIAPRHYRHRNSRLIALRNDPALLGIAPTMTGRNRTSPPGPQLLHRFRHLRSCPLGPWWTLRRSPLPIAQLHLLTAIREGRLRRRLQLLLASARSSRYPGDSSSLPAPSKMSDGSSNRRTIAFKVLSLIRLSSPSYRTGRWRLLPLTSG